jgi:hypothetical protein
MRLHLFAILAFVLSAAPVAAQNLCDATPPSNPQLNNPFDVAFGWDGKDGDGNVVDPATVQVRVTIDGAARPLVALPAPVGTPTAAGCRWYVLPNFTLTKGSHTVTATLVSPDGEGVAPAPFAFGIKGKPPSTVQKVQAAQ